MNIKVTVNATNKYQLLSCLKCNYFQPLRAGNHQVTLPEIIQLFKQICSLLLYMPCTSSCTVADTLKNFFI